MGEGIFSRFDRLVVLDTETTGIRHREDEIIELGYLRIDGAGTVEMEEDELILLSPGRRLPPEIARLTGIEEETIRLRGVEKRQAAERFVRALSGPRVLVAAYNAQFDLCFLYYFLYRLGLADALRGACFLDVLTVYRDRRPYPHRLTDAAASYGVAVEGAHRALEDVKTTLAVLRAMEREENDLEQYINLFGYNPRYGVSGPRISSVRYEPQPYGTREKLYRRLACAGV